MNVVVVNDYAQVTGGATQVALSSARALAARGHAVTLFAAVAPAPGASGLDALRLVCTGQHEILADPRRLRAAVQGLWNVQARRSMQGLLETLDPSETVVHFHGWTKALSSSVIREVSARGFRSVTTLHEYFTACPNGGFFNYPRQSRCTLAPLSAACVATQCDARSYGHKLWRVGRQLVQRHVAQMPARMRHFVTVSELSAQVLRPHLPGDARFHAVPNPIDVTRDEPVAVASQHGFAFLGRLAPEKGCVLLARAARGLEAPLSFVGEGPMREAIMASHPQAHVTGWMTPESARAQLRHCRALVLPSLWYEAQGLVVSEAAAMGVPAIVSDGCAAREAVIDGVTGLWFRSGSESDLRAKLRRLHEDPAFAASLGAAAFEHYWRDPPTLERHVGRLEEVYRLVLAS